MTQEVDPAEAAVVRQVFELRASGLGQKAIAKRLNAEGAPAPRAQQGRPQAWCPSSVRAVLFRERYRGVLVWNRTRKRDRWGQRRRTQNWNFVGPFKKMTFASRMQHQIYWGPLRKPVEWSLKTVLAPWAYVASVLYHDTFWYPTKGRPVMREVLGSDWGRLFQAWEQTTPDAHGYPVADGPGAGVRLTGLRAMATSFGILGTSRKHRSSPTSGEVTTDARP